MVSDFVEHPSSPLWLSESELRSQAVFYVPSFIFYLIFSLAISNTFSLSYTFSLLIIVHCGEILGAVYFILCMLLSYLISTPFFKLGKISSIIVLKLFLYLWHGFFCFFYFYYLQIWSLHRVPDFLNISYLEFLRFNIFFYWGIHFLYLVLSPEILTPISCNLLVSFTSEVFVWCHNFLFVVLFQLGFSLVILLLY